MSYFALIIRRRCAAIAALSAAAIFSGCAAIDSNLTGRVGNLNASLDQAINDGILTNIVRARNLQPLSFVAVSRVNSTQSVNLANGLPTFTFGPGLTTAQHQFAFAGNSMTNNVSGNFDLAPLATKEFARGVSSEISGPELYSLIKQGIPRDLLYNMIVESIEYTEGPCPPNEQSKKIEKSEIKSKATKTETIKTETVKSENTTTRTIKSESTQTETTKMESTRPGPTTASRTTPEPPRTEGARPGTTTADSAKPETHRARSRPEATRMGRPEKPTRLRNDTNDPLYSLFRSTILYLVASGYSIETRVDVNPAWDREDKTSTKFITASRFCFDESLADRVFFQRARPDVDWHCGTKWSRERREKFVPIRKTISLYKPGGGTKEVCDVRFNTRSIYGTFNFLGRQLKDRDETIVRAEEDKDIDWSVLKDPDKLLKEFTDEFEKQDRNPTVLSQMLLRLRSMMDKVGKPMLEMARGRSGPCLAAANVGDESFCVPQGASDNTKRVFSVLAQLLALKTTAADLPVTPTVRVNP